MNKDKKEYFSSPNEEQTCSRVEFEILERESVTFSTWFILWQRAILWMGIC